MQKDNLKDNSRYIYNEFLKQLLERTEAENIKFIHQLDRDICNQIALFTPDLNCPQPFNKFPAYNLIDCIAHIVNKNKLLKTFIQKLNAVTCKKSTWPAVGDGITLDKIALTQKAEEAFVTFVKKLDPLLCQELAQFSGNYNELHDVPSLHIIAEKQSSEIFSWFLRIIGKTVAKKLAPKMFNHAFTIDKANFKVYLDWIGPKFCNEYAKSQPGFIFLSKLTEENRSLFLEMLTTETCDDLVQKNPMFYYDIMNLIESQQFDFFNKLTTEVITKIALSNALTYFLHHHFKLGLKILMTAFEHPLLVKKIADQQTFLTRIAFVDGGESRDMWSPVTRYILQNTPKIKERFSAKLHPEIMKTRVNSQFKHKNIGDILRVQGRTILFQNQENLITAVKILKKKEDPEELKKEFRVTQYLYENKKKLNLKSVFPKPLSVQKAANFIPLLKENLDKDSFNQFTHMTGDPAETLAYTYEVNPKKCDYFTYLHDERINDEIFKKANRDIVHDLYTLLQKGLAFTELADIFHNLEAYHTNRYDGGRYIVLTNLVYNWLSGSGRLTAWKKSVLYPNFRVSGLADLGQCIPINDLFNPNSSFVKNFHKDLYNEVNSQMGNFLLANLIAEYQYILFLIAGFRASKQAQSVKDTQKIWQTAADQTIENCAQAMSLLTGVSETKARAFEFAIVKKESLKTQMGYWMSTDYVKDILHNKIREDIYEANTFITVDVEKLRKGTFNAKLGFAIDGINQDLGAVNGQEPIKEANKAMFWMVNFVFAYYNALHLGLQSLRYIIKEKKPEDSTQMINQSFNFLSNTSQQSLQFSLGKERLKQAHLSENLKSGIMENQKKLAAQKIRYFWRSHKSVKTLTKANPNTFKLG